MGAKKMIQCWCHCLECEYGDHCCRRFKGCDAGDYDNE